MVEKETDGRFVNLMMAEAIEAHSSACQCGTGPLLSTEQRLLGELHGAELKPVMAVMCVERHQRTLVDYLDTETEACEWGRSREGATCCGDCPFGVKLSEPAPTKDTAVVLKDLKRERAETEKMFH